MKFRFCTIVCILGLILLDFREIVSDFIDLRETFLPILRLVGWLRSILEKSVPRVGYS